MIPKVATVTHDTIFNGCALVFHVQAEVSALDLKSVLVSVLHSSLILYMQGRGGGFQQERRSCFEEEILEATSKCSSKQLLHCCWKPPPLEA